MSWTDERVETLRRMWSEGQSASQIARELGGVTRNAVIGKVHRLGLSNRTGAPGVSEPGVPEPGTFEPEASGLGATETETLSGPSDDVPDDVMEETVAMSHSSEDRAESASPAAEPERAEPAHAPMPARRAIIPAGQPLPPQPSANEISPEALASVREVEKKARRLTLMELTERTCKWPIGDPATPEFWFCGLGTQAGKPYCEAHVGVAFQPMSSRRDRRR